MNQETRKNVLKYLQTIPQWKVVTYKYIAEKFDIHPRAVASIMRYNTLPEIYPCYKVVSSSRNISGYNTQRGVEEKIEKLQKDGIDIINWKISKHCIL